MDIKQSNEVKYAAIKEKSKEMVVLLKSIECTSCSICPLGKDGWCSRENLVKYLESEIKQ